MSGKRASGLDWTVVDEGWGRKAVDFATLSEPANCREYVALHHMLGVDTGDRLLDVACGAGWPLSSRSARGADCAGIDASARLVAVARDRSPRADIRVGDMHALPWDDGGFTVVTSFRGIWGTTPAALEEVWRVLRPGGRIGLTVWGHLKVSPGVWALTPFRLAAEPKVANQAAMVALGRPGRVRNSWPAAASWTCSGAPSRSRGSSPIPDCSPVHWPRPDRLTRPSSTSARLRSPRRQCRPRPLQVRNGLPLRAEIDVAGYLGRKPDPDGTRS